MIGVLVDLLIVLGLVIGTIVAVVVCFLLMSPAWAVGVAVVSWLDRAEERSMELYWRWEDYWKEKEREWSK